MFISSYTTTYFFVKNFFFEYIYFSEYDIRMFLFVFWFSNRPSIKYIRNWENRGGVNQNVYRCAQGEGYHASCLRTHLHYLFSCFCLVASCFICRNLTLPSFKRGVFVRNGYFCPMRSISVVMK